MEVGEQHVDDLEVVVAVDEERGASFEGPGGGALEGSDRRRAHGDNPVRLLAGVEGLSRHPVALRVDLVVLGSLGRHRAEGVEPDGEVDLADLDTAGAATLEHAVGEVEAGGGRRHRSGFGGVHRLIALRVGEGGVDVRRERSLPVGREGRHRVTGVQAHGPAAVGEPLPDLDVEIVAGMQHRPLGQTAARLHQRLPCARLVSRLQQQHLDSPACRLL